MMEAKDGNKVKIHYTVKIVGRTSMAHQNGLCGFQVPFEFKIHYGMLTLTFLTRL